MRPSLHAMILAVLLTAVTAVVAAEAESDRVAKIKSAYLLNFIRYAQWPGSAFVSTDAPIRLCVAGEDPLGHYLDLTVRDQYVAGRAIQVERIPGNIGSIVLTRHNCHLLFLSRSELDQSHAMLAQARGTSLLTVGETHEFIGQGAMLALSLEGDRIVFHANHGRLKEATVKLSSKILQLAGQRSVRNDTASNRP